MRAIDTNVVVRLVAQDEAQQTDAAIRAIADGAWISHVVLIEAIWVLKSYYRLARTELQNTIAVLLKHEKLVVQESDVVASALAAYRASKRVEFSDCMIVEIARKAGHGPVGTFDRDLGQLDGAQRLSAKA